MSDTTKVKRKIAKLERILMGETKPNGMHPDWPKIQRQKREKEAQARAHLTAAQGPSYVGVLHPACVADILGWTKGLAVLRSCPSHRGELVTVSGTEYTHSAFTIVDDYPQKKQESAAKARAHLAGSRYRYGSNNFRRR